MLASSDKPMPFGGLKRELHVTPRRAAFLTSR